VTKMPKVTMNTHKVVVQMDSQYGKPFGQNATMFSGYVGMLAKHHLSILVNSWDDIEEADKNLLWQDILVIMYFILMCNYVFYVNVCLYKLVRLHKLMC